MSAVSWMSGRVRYLQVDRGRSMNTLRTYQHACGCSSGRCWCREAADATREDVEVWWRSRAHLAASSRNNELAAVRGFFTWLVLYDHRDDDPTRRVLALPQPKGLPRPIGRAELQMVMASVDGEVRRAIALGAYGGLRISEAAGLGWDGIDRETQRIRVTGKGGKTRLVGLLALLLDELLPDTGGNVVTGGGRRYAAQSLDRRVNRAVRAAGVDATYHQLRHRYGTLAVASGVPLLSVQRAMGHASPATTAIYAASSDADLDLIAAAVTM